MLTERREKLLRFIVDEYVNSAQPVGSHAIVEKYGLPVSTATVRKEMMRLEEDGYISQPHTSAGRVPSDKGYRYYVESLMADEAPPRSLQEMIRHQFHQSAHEVEEWARLAAAILAAHLHNAAVVTPPHSTRPRLRWLEMVSLHDFLVLLVLVLQEARILRQTLALDETRSQDELAAMAGRLNELFAGKTGDEMRRSPAELSRLEASVVAAAAELMEDEDAAFEPAFLVGLRDMLGQPEFSDSDRILALLELMEERNLSQAIPLRLVQREGVSVIIGREHPSDAMRQCSVVITRYGGPAGLRGTLSVVGPTRMHYPRAVSLVRYMASVMDELLGAQFG